MPRRPLIIFAAVAICASSYGQSVTSPKQQLGHDLGEDYFLADYKQLQDYWHRLERESPRMKVVEIGKSEEGRPELMAILSSPENIKHLDRYRDIARRLALAEGLTDRQARQLAADGKAIVWIDGGLHASEVLGAQQLMETVYRLASKNDAETQRILKDCIVLCVHANPDGMDLCADWYMRQSDPKKRTLSDLPRLWQKYIGHDNNRDFYAVTQSETKNMCNIMFREWFPQIVYNHHQSGPAGTVLFQPPFRDPFNYLFDPLIPVGIDLVGAAMQNRFIEEGKPGATTRSGAPYSTWWNGGLRTTAYFHNMIGLLTEMIGSPTPSQIPYLPDKLLPKGDLPFPIEPQEWHFRQSIEYSVTANMAVLDLASRYREQFLYNIYQMGKHSIENGSKDHWTITPTRINWAKADRDAGFRALRDPANRDPREYIVSADQPDFPTAVKFLNTLVLNGVTVHRATAAFVAGGKTYPAGSYLVKAAQAFRPYVLDAFEPQDHPNDLAYPGGPPIPPYDSAGWTLAYQMGVQFDRVLDALEGPFEAVHDVLKPTPGAVAGAPQAAGFLLSHAQNDTFTATLNLLEGGDKVYWLTEPLKVGSTEYPPGSIYVPASTSAGGTLRRLANDLGISVVTLTEAPAGAALKLKQPRIGLWDRYGGSMPSGWTRWLFERFGFPFEVVYAPQLDAGDLIKKYDVLVFVDGAVPAAAAGGRGGRDVDPQTIPEEYRNRLGSVTLAKTIPQLRQFMEDGGTVVTIGSSTNLAYVLKLPVENALVEKDADGAEKRLPSTKFYIPGSLLKVRIDNADPVSYGMPQYVDAMFDNSPAFRLAQGAEQQGVRRIGWYDSATPLRSGWALGQERLMDAAAVVEATVGKGRLLMFGPEIAFRGQPHATFKLLFNSIFLSSATRVAKAEG